MAIFVVIGSKNTYLVEDVEYRSTSFLTGSVEIHAATADDNVSVQMPGPEGDIFVDKKILDR